MTMNPDVKEQWATALESGDYQQGYGSLNPDEGFYCCLGVLCDVAAKAEVTKGVTRGGGTLYDGENCFIPPAVMTWAGLTNHNPIVNYETGEPHTLTYLNDQLRISFADIAALVREQL